tara:strand:- start:1356 stop:2264 length:909 start_codon:yes stop_codon:yes gene_type:complete
MKKKTNFKPLVSIIINCHNAGDFILKSIKSVLNQNYKNWELIIFDNNSKDKTSSIVKKFLKNKKIKYYKSNLFLNLYHARNLALKKSKGEFVSFLDADDWLVKDKLKKQIKFLFKNKNINIIYSNLYLFNQRNNEKKIFSKEMLYNGKITQQLLDDFKMPILTTLIRKKIFKKYKFDANYNIIGDFDLFIRVSLEEKILSMQEPLAFYRLHSSNMSSRRLDLNISELENWIKKNKIKKKFKNFNYTKIFRKIKTLKIKNNLLMGHKIKTIKELIKSPIEINNFKFLPFLLLPNKVAKKIILK